MIPIRSISAAHFRAPSLRLLSAARVGKLALALTTAALCFSSVISAAQQTRADAEKDPVLKAMLEELDRSKASLQLKGFEKPFFIEYRIEDVTSYETRAEFGSSEGSQNNHQRVARVTVRVGDYKLDSSTPRGDGSVEMAAIDDDPIAIRSALWTATDEAYKDALAAYAQKQAELKQVQTPPQADDFSREAPLVSLAGPAALDLNEQARQSWVERVATDSGLYRTAPAARDTQVQYCIASFSARAITTRLVNSEGAILRKSATSYQESFGVGTQAADGMRIDRSNASNGASLKDLDSSDAFQKQALGLIASLADLRSAPLVEEEYHGPVLLSADSSTDVMYSLLANSLAATRPRLGTEARTNGPFASSYHVRILPDFLDVVDDPGLKSFDGKTLLGAYDVDDQGVAAKAVDLVAAGKLENFVIGRVPIRDLPQSNGHARASLTGPARSTIGVLKISAENGLPDADLERKLLDMAKDRGLTSVYYAATMGPEMTPRLLYKLTPDGKRQLVRGAVLADLDQRALRSGIEAAGRDLWTTNYVGEVPHTVLAPALLLSDVTVKRANEKNNKLPYYPPPD